MDCFVSSEILVWPQKCTKNTKVLDADYADDADSYSCEKAIRRPARRTAGRSRGICDELRIHKLFCDLSSIASSGSALVINFFCSEASFLSSFFTSSAGGSSSGLIFRLISSFRTS